MAVEIISRSIFTKAWERARMELATPVSEVRQASVITHITDFTTWPGGCVLYCFLILLWPVCDYGMSSPYSLTFFYLENISSAVSSLGKYGYAIFA